MSAADRTPDEITAEIEQTRERLAATIDQLLYRAQPKTIASRQLDSIKASFREEDGSVDTAMVAKVAGGVAAFVALVVLIRKVAR